MQSVVDFVESQAALSEGSSAASELPDTASQELAAAGVSVGTFLQLFPLLLELFRNEQVRELVAKILAALKPQS